MVVIGGGLAGLTAARTIVRHDSSLRVTLLEADQRLGGRVLSVKSGGRHFDLGAHWVGSTQSHVMGLVRQFNLGLRPQYLAGRKLMQVGDLKVRSYDSVLPSLGSWLAVLELGWLTNKLDSLASQVNTKDPVASLTEGHQLDAVTLSCWLTLHTRFQAVRDVVAAAVRTTFGVEPDQMSVLFFLAIIKSAGGLSQLVEATEGAAQEFVVEGGAMSIVESLYEDIKSEVNVLMGEPVSTVEQHRDGSVFVLTGGGRIIKCSRVVVSVPPCQQARINWLPALKPRKQFAVQSCQFGLLIKVILEFAQPFWRQEGFSGELVSSGSPLCISFDDSQGDSPALLTFIGGREAVLWADKPEKELKAAVVRQLAECFGDWAYDYTNIRLKTWADQPFIGGSPVAVPAVGSMFLYPALRELHHRVHFAGTETATEWLGYMEGAVQSGVRAGLEVLNHLKPQSLSPSELAVSGREGILRSFLNCFLTGTAALHCPSHGAGRQQVWEDLQTARHHPSSQSYRGSSLTQITKQIFSLLYSFPVM